MVKIFKNYENNGDMVVLTTDMTLDEFTRNLSNATLAALEQRVGDHEFTLEGILEQAFQIAFKISGYKAERVHESRVLTAGYSSPSQCWELSEAPTPKRDYEGFGCMDKGCMDKQRDVESDKDL